MMAAIRPWQPAGPRSPPAHEVTPQAQGPRSRPEGRPTAARSGVLYGRLPLQCFGQRFGGPGTDPCAPVPHLPVCAWTALGRPAGPSGARGLGRAACSWLGPAGPVAAGLAGPSRCSGAREPAPSVSATAKIDRAPLLTDRVRRARMHGLVGARDACSLCTTGACQEGRGAGRRCGSDRRG